MWVTQNQTHSGRKLAINSIPWVILRILRFMEGFMGWMSRKNSFYLRRKNLKPRFFNITLSRRHFWWRDLTTRPHYWFFWHEFYENNKKIFALFLPDPDGNVSGHSNPIELGRDGWPSVDSPTGTEIWAKFIRTFFSRALNAFWKSSF